MGELEHLTINGMHQKKIKKWQFLGFCKNPSKEAAKKFQLIFVWAKKNSRTQSDIIKPSKKLVIEWIGLSDNKW
jgi:hypothetical protein